MNLRLAKPSDKSFIYHSWLKCYLVESPVTKYIKSERTFFTGHHNVLDKIFERPNVIIRIACDGQDEDVIYGYLVYEPGLIHFIYVKGPFRKMGVGRKLLESIGDFNTFKISHVTYTLLDLWSHGKVKCEYNPYWGDS